ncbi:hypothetical protein B7495_14550 [Cryobacterium sp. LW097]|uniref:hypothetical protein n=1 Tax=Cryobacterium sp. LW097 TaxID=1978566 RepID=UPI000B4CD3C4|nr:hypothetical protein [Cryobacterium sp. LW097]ASD23179.1 hypothetical protein B7495_14550 [Cryobacterium sp. LW097]
MSRRDKTDVLVIGGEPRVNLLPPEVHKQRKAKAVRRQLGLGVVGVIALMIVGTTLLMVLATTAEQQLADEQELTAGLLAEQTKYADVRTVQSEVDLVKAAQQVGVSTEIDWKTYLDGVQAILPASVTIGTVAVDSASPLAVFGQPTSPLQGARVATVSFTAESAVLPDVPTWLNSLSTLPGYADALPGSLTRDEAGVYTVAITMHVNDAAYARRFEAEGE